MTITTATYNNTPEKNEKILKSLSQKLYLQQPPDTTYIHTGVYPILPNIGITYTKTQNR